MSLKLSNIKMKLFMLGYFEFTSHTFTYYYFYMEYCSVSGFSFDCKDRFSQMYSWTYAWSLNKYIYDAHSLWSLSKM